MKHTNIHIIGVPEEGERWVAQISSASVFGLCVNYSFLKTRSNRKTSSKSPGVCENVDL